MILLWYHEWNKWNNHNKINPVKFEDRFRIVISDQLFKNENTKNIKLALEYLQQILEDTKKTEEKVMGFKVNS